MTDLVRVRTLKVLHVLSVVDMAVTDATNLAIGSVIVLGKALSGGGCGPVSSIFNL
jgi:hypothetical protein